MFALDQAELAQALFSEIGDALFLLDPDTDQLLEVNPVALRLTGYSRAELLDFSATHLFRFEAPGGVQRLKGAFTKTMIFHGQDGFLLRTKEGSWVPVSVTVSRLHLEPKTLGLIIARDDRERRAALTQTLRVEAELRKVLGSSPAALWSAERFPGPDVFVGWQFRYVSPRLARIAGRVPEYLDHPFKWGELVHPLDRDAYTAALRRLLIDGTDFEQHYRVQSPDGVRWVLDRLQVVRDTNKRPVRLDGCVTDVTEQRQAEEALRQSEERFRALVEKSRDGIMLVDGQSAVLYATPALKHVLGYEPEEVIGRNSLDLVHPDDRPAALEKMAYCLQQPGEDVPFSFRGLAADGSTRVIELTGVNRLDDPSVHAVVFNYRDVTDRDRMEDELRQSHKMEAVGRLAGGIAHDFNNLLTVVLGNLELVRSGVATGDDAEEMLAAAERAAKQAADLTKQMLGFARRQPLRTATVDLNALARDAIHLLRRTIDPRIIIRFNPVPDLRPVAADPVQVQQVLMNLCLNARDAMPDGGVLTVETTNTEAAPGTLAARPFGLLSVTDTGVGMTDEVRAKIFDPFFTTKGVGQGTGLGLAVVYGVAKAHGGRVEVTSAPGAGSRFDVYLPCAVGEASSAPHVKESRQDVRKGGGETVLVADDEAAVRQLAQTALEMAGYRVLIATDGAEALDAFRDAKDRVRLVVLDATMPRMSGRQVFDAIRRIDPDVKILFASGYHGGGLLPDSAPGTRMLNKPYIPSQLAAAVYDMLAAPNAK